MDQAGGEMDGFARGLCSQHIQRFDRHVTDQVTTKLFAENPPDGLGTDLVSLNIQRGRDHGIPGKVQNVCSAQQSNVSSRGPV